MILDLEGRRVMGLNDAGSFVWGLLDGVRTVHEIAAAVAERFRVVEERAMADVEVFLALLRSRGLVET